MEKNYEQVVMEVLQETGINYQSLFEYLIQYKYLFDPVIKIEQAPSQHVFSIKVESSCHSFISNGFISHNTECKLAKISDELLVDIDKETVDFVPNFDGSLQEPSVLPAKLPNLLINGSSGIAVGMATNIPPHNIREVIDGTVALIDNPSATVHDLMQHIKGPDFPTAAIISGTQEIQRAYLTGLGKIMVKARTEIEKHKDREWIIINEIPFQLNKAGLVEQIAELVRDKKLVGISDLRDESDRDGMRVVI
ncbi:hypothetical protein HYU19_05445, partial [Candidatus Woesearchaeota archaeon]|nr:hypothetical protein [Candidatus Woesearchaeota archaeon]